MSIKARAMQYGRLFGNWKIRDFIGEGSQGKTGVFRIIKSYDSFQEENALKVVTLLRKDGWPEDLPDEARKEYQANKTALCAQAVNEVKLMNRLAGDPYVVSYQNWEFCDWEESGEFGCDLLIQMPLLMTLRKLPKTDGAFSEDEIRRIGRDICKALIRCGEENIIHRDIKPDNIFLLPNRKGNYMLGDFGISRILESGMGGASTSIGTMDYAAPEQFGPGYDNRVDIYSLGLTLYELANENRLPFWEPGRGKVEAVKQRLSGSTLPPPSQAGPALAQIILRACAFRPEDRYQSAEEFLAALEGAQPKISIPKKEISTPRKEHGSEWINTPVAVLSRRAQQGDASAQYSLGMCYYVGRVVPKNHETALSWFHEAAAQGHAQAMAYIGIYYYAGLGGVERNLREYFNWTRLSAENGDPSSMFRMGRCYLRGRMVPQDIDTAIQWLCKSAELGCWEGMMELAQCYIDGLGVEKDLAEAERLLQEAADRGSTDAKKRLDAFRSASGSN